MLEPFLWQFTDCPNLDGLLRHGASNGSEAASLAEEVKLLREVVNAGAYSQAKGEAVKMPAGDQSLAELDGLHFINDRLSCLTRL